MARAEQIAAFTAYLERVAVGAEAKVQAVIDEEADAMVGLAKSACPVNDLDSHPGQLRESIHKAPGKDALQRYVIADATDPKGNWYGIHVELGHRTKEGGHIPAHPFFFPSWRLLKREAKKRIGLALKEAIKGG